MKYLKIALLFMAAFLINAVAPYLLTHVAQFGGTETAIANALWCTGLILVFGWASSKVCEGTVFPNFTLQLLIGIVLHDALAPLSVHLIFAVVVCTALAAIILKSGGDEIERPVFIKIAFPTLMISVIGYLLTFFIMFPLLIWVGLDGKTAALLSAIIGSTDPAALIPTLKKLTFRDNYKRITGLAIAESALNDAVGAIFTAAVAAMIISGNNLDDLTALSQGVFSTDNLLLLGGQLLFGTLAGIIGWLLMHLYEKYKSAQYAHGRGDAPYDFAVILAVPLVTFFFAQAIHGNGFLAAFVAGLLANFNHGSNYFNTLLQNMETQIESVAKPTIFMMVGPFVSLHTLGETALPGLLVSLLFIVVARPLAVFLSMLPTTISLKEKLFLCVVRETGVIPVVLAVITVAQFPELNLLMPLTAWVVIWTLTILPAITPWWSRVLKMVE